MATMDPDSINAKNTSGFEAGADFSMDRGVPKVSLKLRRNTEQSVASRELGTEHGEQLRQVGALHDPFPQLPQVAQLPQVSVPQVSLDDVDPIFKERRIYLTEREARALNEFLYGWRNHPEGETVAVEIAEEDLDMLLGVFRDLRAYEQLRTAPSGFTSFSNTYATYRKEAQ